MHQSKQIEVMWYEHINPTFSFLNIFTLIIIIYSLTYTLKLKHDLAFNFDKSFILLSSNLPIRKLTFFENKMYPKLSVGLGGGCSK